MKKILTFMAYALMIAALTSCGSDKDDPDPEKPDKTVAVEEISLFGYETQELTAGDDAKIVPFMVMPEDATDKSVTVTSTDTKVCAAVHKTFDKPFGSFTEYVELTPIAEGTATVTITSKSTPSVKSTITVTVKAAAGEEKPGEEEKPEEEPRMKYVGFYVTYPDRSHKMFPATGGTAEAQAGTELEVHLINGSRGGFTYYPDAVTGARWESTNTTVATIADATSTSRNTITLRSPGSTIIRVTAPDGSQSSFTLNVTKAAVDSRFALTGTDGKKYLLTNIVYYNDSYAIDYDDAGELKTIGGMARLSDGRYRSGNYTLAFRFKSGTKLIERMEIESEAGGSRKSYICTLTYDASSRLTGFTAELSDNEGVVSRRDGTYTWSSDKLLRSKEEYSIGGGGTHNNSVNYGGNKANPLRVAGITPVLWAGPFSSILPAPAWASLSALGCFGVGASVLPTGITTTFERPERSPLSYEVECSLSSAGLLSQERFAGTGFNGIALLKYEYKAQ